MAAYRCQVLCLYKNMMREAQKFTAYNFRSYALRRIRDAFREHKLETDPATIDNLMQTAHKNMEIIKRQVTISQLYRSGKLVIEERAKATAR